MDNGVSKKFSLRTGSVRDACVSFVVLSNKIHTRTLLLKTILGFKRVAWRDKKCRRTQQSPSIPSQQNFWVTPMIQSKL